MSSNTEYARDFERLAGSHVVEWLASEMALGEEPLVWRHPSVPYLQLTSLTARLAAGGALCIRSQPDTGHAFHGLYFAEMEALPQPFDVDPESMFRDRRPDELPIGCIVATEARTDEAGNILAVTMSIDGTVVELIAGEVHEQFDGTYSIVTPDESILVRISGVHA